VLDQRARGGLNRVIAPLIRWLARSPITPTWITIVGLGVTVAGAGFVAAGHPTTGALVVAVGALLDTIDGPLARATGRAGPRGAFIDTMADRFGEVALLVGVAYWVAGDRTLVTLTMIGLAMSLLIPFVRAKAEAADVDGRGGLMGRAERMILLLAGLFLAGFWNDVLTVTLWAFAVLTSLTVAQRIFKTWRQLEA
jgi:CDP-diacylglycerol--glycerol-3-phosphate 3-phosphatidyltransferase